MKIIPVTDKFLGSLIGAYIGNHYLETRHGQWPSVSSSSIYESWLLSMQPHSLIPPDPSDVSLISALPWLLYHHDDSSYRHQWFVKTLTSNRSQQRSTIDAKTINAAGEFFLLGDCLEWLMQSSLQDQKPQSRLCQYLRQKQSTYPLTTSVQLNQFIEVLDAVCSDTKPQILKTTDSWPTIRLALERCLRHRENMALALTGPNLSIPIAALTGCLLGAWHGPSIIPTKWLMALTYDSRQSLNDMAQNLYRRWAGADNTVTNFEAFPLDL